MTAANASDAAFGAVPELWLAELRLSRGELVQRLVTYLDAIRPA